jgi:hypothetical protein
VAFPTVINDNGTYKMWFYGWDGVNSRIGYAASPDGIVWTKYAGNPVLAGGGFGAWDAGGVDHPMVVQDGGPYKMWYGGTDSSNSRTGYAESSDGITWIKGAGNPVIDLGDPGTWDSVRAWAVAAASNGSTYEIWYTGDDLSKWRIGHALGGCLADFNGDGNTDVMDLTAFGLHFGRNDCD